MQSHRELSLRLDEALDMVGASQSMRLLHRRAATTGEILLTKNLELMRGKRAIIYQCGSSYEGTVIPDTASDIDLIYAFTDWSLVTHRLMAGSGLRLLVFRDDWTYPGYVKLQVLLDGRPLTDEHLGAGERWGFDQRGRTCLKHHYHGENRHGPADMNISEDGKHLTDRVPALKCDGIPPFAAEWIRRRRSHSWPSDQQLDQMRVMGCMVVEVGFYKSPEKNIEWKLSFSLQERLLMKSLNTCIYQHKVYILLKLVKKNILENELSPEFVHKESLSSYHCKTCIFYMAELIPARFWTRENIYVRLLECLRLLLNWLRNRFCPSYFIKEQNLFEKDGFERFIEPLERSVDQILQSGHQFLFKIQSDHIGDMLRSGYFRLYRLVTDPKVNKYIFDISVQTIDSIIATRRFTLSASNRNQDVLPFLSTQIEAIQSQDRDSGHTPEETKHALRNITPWLHFQLGLEFANRSITCSTRCDGKGLMKRVDSHFHKANKTGFANVLLAQASILFRFGKFEECFLLLQKVEARWSFRVIGWCSCESRRTFVPGARQLHDDYPAMRNMSVTKLIRNYIATCVVFLPSQSELAPSPVQYEMFRSLGTSPGSRDVLKDDWFDWAVVDAKVYLHFMQYLVCSRLDREHHKHIAIDNLDSLIQNAPDNSLHHEETAYNLLGWIYPKEHSTVDAVRCFIRSWQIRPLHNAAKFHMWSVWQTLAEEQPQDSADNP